MPLMTDSELIWKFQKLDNNHVQGKFRIAGYFRAQSDKYISKQGIELSHCRTVPLLWETAVTELVVETNVLM